MIWQNCKARHHSSMTGRAKLPLYLFQTHLIEENEVNEGKDFCSWFPLLPSVQNLYLGSAFISTLRSGRLGGLMCAT
ncbi:MAG: hypothetical protein WDN00_07680 [Limisphaerales bacterium]